MISSLFSRHYKAVSRHVHKLSFLQNGPINEFLPPAFVFDIDGVLIRGKNVLPAAINAMKELYVPDGSTPKVPVAFLTNGGGVSEADKAKQLSNWLGVNVSASQVVLSHTPFKSFASQYAEKPVIVVGRGRVVEVAHSYGFKKVVTTHSLARALPHSVPFWREKEEWLEKHHKEPAAVTSYGTINEPIAAIFIFHDPMDWYLDLQILSDVITSGGVLGRRHTDVPEDAPPVEVFFSNPDLLWANEHSVARFGQGTFAACLETLHKQLTGEDIKVKRVFGKPNPEPYRLIEELLIKQARKLGYIQSTSEAITGGKLPFSRIFAIGDNPAADVAGANSAGHPWVSVLVRTGVFQSDKENCHIDPAHIVVDDVEKAIHAADHHLRSVKWHSMR